MATSFDANAVKSLNESSSRKRFSFKSFSQRVADIDINVYRSLDPLKSEPSEGSSFFRDSLAEWRELNTSGDFISFYEEIFPLVQTLPQIILHKELILSKILDRLQMKCRLSLEPLFSLIAALSRDLLEDFKRYLPRVVHSLVSLLTSGADREPEIMEQIFTSWSCIMMYMQKYLITNLVHVLKVTRKLRYYPKDYVREFVAESLSFLFRKASLQQLIKGTRKVLREVARKPSTPRKSSASELLRFTLRGTSSKLHSRAEELLHLLLDKSSFDIVGQEVGDSDSVVEVMISTFSSLSEELEPKDLNIMLKCLLKVIGDTTDTISSDSSVYLSRLLSLLICASENGYTKKASDYHPLLELARSLVKDMNRPTQVIDKVFMLLLCIVDGLYSANEMQALYEDLFDWAPVFSVCNNSLLGFLEGLLLRDVSILVVFRTDIIRALNDLLEVSEAAVINLLLIFIERLHMPTSGFLKGVPSKSFSKLCSFLRETLLSWTGMIINAAQGSSLPLQFEESKIAILWAAIKCSPYILNVNENHSVLLDLLNALDKHLVTESGFPKTICQSLIGAIMESHSKTLIDCENGADEAAVGYFMSFAIKYPSSSHILSAAADILDSAFGIPTQEQINYKTYLLDLPGRKNVDVLKAFAENLCHCDKQLRLSSLRILSHYEHSELISSVEQVGENEAVNSISGTGLLNKQGRNVLGLLLLIESIPLSIKTSRSVILLLSRLQMSISTGRLSEQYVPALLYGLIGIFHTRFSYVWNPAVECLAMVISQHVGCIWDTFVHYLDSCQSVLLLPHDQSCRISNESLNKAVDLVGHFNSYVSSLSDSTPSASVFSLLLQSLQKVPSLVESRTRQIVPLFLKFLGYDVDELKSVGVHMLQNYVHKEWKEALKEWLNLFRLMRNPKSFFREQFLKEVFLYRLLDDNDAEVQTRVLDCLLNWKDGFLVPYNSHLRNLISAKNLREELTTWSLSKESNLIDEKHRPHVVPVVIRILVSKVRKLKTLASTKHSSVHNRRAILGFLAQLEVNELSLLFDLLIKPLQTAVRGANESDKCIPISSSLTDICSSLTVDDMKDLSWKKMYSFLHVIEEVFEVFDQWRINSFLKLLMGCVVCILECCTVTLEHLKSVGLTSYDPDDTSMVEQVGESTKQMMVCTNMKQLKELRSLCIKITSSALNKYEDYSFGDDFWDRFFGAVRPLITGFKQEGASSERANSLFSCFLAMSRSLKFVPLLSREKNLVPDIFSILTVPTASDAVISSVLIFVENLLNLDFELGDEDSSVKKILLPHLDVLIISLHSLFSPDNTRHRKLASYLGDKELSILKLLSKYVTDPVASTKFIEILFPLLEKKSQNAESRVKILQIIQHVVPYVGSKFSEKYLTSLSSLLTFVGLEVRLAICDVLNSLAQSDSSVQIVAKILSELNASSSMEIDGLDYDTIIGAYEKINKDFFYTVNKEQTSILLSHSIYDMSSEEMILRQSAYGMLLNFVYFSLEILNSEKSDIDLWSEVCVKQLISKLLLKHMGKAMHKETTIQKIWIALLREMVSNIPKVANLESYGSLCSEDPEQDFFSNIVHLQKHRRARALLKFIRCFNQSQLSEAITKTVFVPLFFNILFELQDGKGENVRLACMEALGSISGRMSWKEYRALLMSCFREMNIKRNKQRVLLRLICSILDHFPPAKDIQATETDSSGVSPELVDIQTFLQGTLLSKIQKLLSFDSDKVNINVCLVALKLLKLLPREMMEQRLPSIIQRISNLLKNRLDSVREEARAAMAVCLKELGPEYLQVMLQSLRSTLKRGYELHVLGYSVHFLLTKFLVTPSIGKLDYCLDDLLSVAENDILGDVSEQKDVDKIASKMKETRKQKSYDSLKLIAQSITFRTHALKLLSPVMVHLQKQLTPKLKLKLESMLNHIAAGIENNPSVNKTDLFVFVYRLINDGLGDENSAEKNPFTSKTKKEGLEVGEQMSNPDRLIRVNPRYSHLVTVFALRLLHNYTKKSQLRKKDEDQLSLLDPFVSLLCDCLSSKNEHIVSTAVRCLSSLISLPLPSLESLANKLKNSLLSIAQGSGNAGSPLMESCLRLLTLLLRNTRITLATDQLHMLIQFPLFIDIERNPSFVALSLLKAIVNRKLVVPEVYDLVKKVAELIVTSQVESVRNLCSKILLQFLMDYHLSEKRLQEHLDFLLSNLGYEHSTGREAVLEMLHTIIKKFPVSVIDQQSQTLFVHLVVCLSNDQDSNVRSMTGHAIKLLIGRLSPPSVHSIIEYSFSWYVGEQKHLAAQVLGLLVEVMAEGFKNYNARALCEIQRILQLSVSSVTNNPDDISTEGAVPLWKEAYYSMVLMEKILRQFDELYLDKDLEETWERICDLLIHPHIWLRNISNRLLDLYFPRVAEARLETSFLMKPGRVFRVAASLCFQLRTQHVDDTAIITRNLVFTICHLHFLLDRHGVTDFPKLWTNLDVCEQDHFLKAFQVIDPRKGTSMVAYLSSDHNSTQKIEPETEAHQHFFVSYLLKKLGKLALQPEFVQIKIILNCFKLISQKLLVQENSVPTAVEGNNLSYAYQLLLPVYKLCEGYAGKVISDDVKQLAEEVCESIRKDMGMQKFVEIYSNIRTNLKVKRDKRKQQDKLMAVINPMRNAKRKLRVAAKNRTNKRRKIMNMKMGRWMR